MHNRGLGNLLEHGQRGLRGRKRGHEAQCSTVLDSLGKGEHTGGSTIDASQAQGYVTNFKAADPDSDGTLTKAEFQAACANGMVQDLASSGAAAGSEGSDSAMPPAAERPSNLPPSKKQY